MNNESVKNLRPAAKHVSHTDVLIVGAGISGLGAAYELKEQSPDHSFLILEGMDNFGGTWRCHKYPGLRSDSDLYTFGYRFKPWRGKPIASAQQILDYLGEVIDDNDLAKHIRYRQRIVEASWSSEDEIWTLFVNDQNTGEVVTYTCNFLWMCQGYYRHSEGYTPHWPSMGDYKGKIVHPQTWPEDLDCEGKKIVVIGSGATAATIVPALAGKCEHVTMLQRSPTYFVATENRIKLADQLRSLDVDEEWVHEIVRRKIVVDRQVFLKKTKEDTALVKQEMLDKLLEYLPQETIDEHFTPSYRPWQQRVAAVPNGDLFQSISSGQASVETDTIEKFTEKGILLKSGRELDADVVVTATGFNLCVFGDIEFKVDGESVDFSKTVTYRGMMFTGVPNMAWVMGYLFSASWTMRVDMVADFVCRLINGMRERGQKKVSIELRPEEKDMELDEWLAEDQFNPGYLTRGKHLWPKRGNTEEWAHSENYWWEREAFPKIDMEASPFIYDKSGSQ